MSETEIDSVLELIDQERNSTKQPYVPLVFTKPHKKPICFEISNDVTERPSKRIDKSECVHEYQENLVLERVMAALIHQGYRCHLGVYQNRKSKS